MGLSSLCAYFLCATRERCDVAEELLLFKIFNIVLKIICGNIIWGCIHHSFNAYIIIRRKLHISISMLCKMGDKTLSLNIEKNRSEIEIQIFYAHKFNYFNLLEMKLSIFE